MKYDAIWKYKKDDKVLYIVSDHDSVDDFDVDHSDLTDEGDVEAFGFVLEQVIYCDTCKHSHTKRLDSCYGFFGFDPEINGMLDYADITVEDFQTNWKKFK